jgi:hypothetical protein
MSHASWAAREAKRDEFAPELGSAVAPLLPTAVEMVVIPPEGAGPPRLEPARCQTGAKPAPDRLAFGADCGSDALEGEASGFQTSRFLVRACHRA